MYAIFVLILRQLPLPQWMQLVHFIPAMLRHHAAPSRGARVAAILRYLRKKQEQEQVLKCV